MTQAQFLPVYLNIEIKINHFYSTASLFAMQNAVIATTILSVRPSARYMLVRYPDE